MGCKLTAETATLRNFTEMLLRQSVTIRAFVNSSLVAAGAALVLAGLAMPVAALFDAARGVPAPDRHGVDRALGEMTYAIPGLVISVAFILAFIRPLPLLGVSIYNTLWIILLAYLCAFFAIALKPVSAAFLQLDPALDEAAQVAGAGVFRRMWRDHLPADRCPAAAVGRDPCIS